MLTKIVQDFLIIWATIDPVGTLAIFASVTAKLDAASRRRTAIRTIAYASAVLFGAILLGQWILDAMGIRLISFQIAGGIILFLFGLQMIFGDQSLEVSKESNHDLAVFPLAIPATATPGAILAVILLTDNNTHSVVEQMITGSMVAVVMLLTLLILLLSTPIIRVIGFGGTGILTRIMGMILAGFSIELLLDAMGMFENWRPLPIGEND